MHTFHPQTQLFFEQFKDIVSSAINQKKVTIERYVIETHSNNYYNYKFNSQFEFNYEHNYYVEKEWQRNKPLVRYHVREYQEREQTDIAQTVIDDLIHAFIEPGMHFQWVMQYFADLKFIWTDALFVLDMPYEDKQKLFDILGPSTRVHQLIHEHFDKPHSFKMMMNTYEKYGGDVDESCYIDVLEDILNHCYTSPELNDELLSVAKSYIALYINKFEINKYQQRDIFEKLRELVPKEQLIFFKDNFKHITFIDPDSIEKNNLQLKKNILDETPINIKKLWIDKDTIAAHFPEIITEDDITNIIYWFTLSIHEEEKQSLDIEDIALRGQYLYIESLHTIDTEKITHCLYSVLYTFANLPFEEFKAIKKHFNEDRKNNKPFTILKPHIMKAVLDYELPATKKRSIFKKI